MTDQAQRVQLPRGQWADLRPRLKNGARNRLVRLGAQVAAAFNVDPSTLTEGADPDELGLAVMANVKDVGTSVDAMQVLQTETIVAWVAAWSPALAASLGSLPTVENLDDMDSDQYDVLLAACEAMTAADQKATVITPDDAGDPDSFTVPSVASVPASEGSPSSTDPVTPISSTDSASTDTGS